MSVSVRVRNVLLVAMVLCAIALDTASAVSVAHAKARRAKRAARLGALNAGATQHTVVCEADAMERAMAKARAGNAGWFDDIVDGISSAVDAINVGKQWDCKKCSMCTEKIDEFGKDIIGAISGKAVEEISSTLICATTFDVAILGLCSAIAIPIPVPGLTPIVCPPFVIYAHSKCSDIMADVMKDLTGPVLKKLKAKTVTVKDLPSLDSAKLCKKLELCPKVRKDC